MSRQTFITANQQQHMHSECAYRLQQATFAEPHMAELTPESPKQQLAPLARKANALSPPLRGNMVKPRVEVFEAAEPSGSSRGGLMTGTLI